MEASKKGRADKYLGVAAKDVPGGGYCCKWTAYVILGDASHNQGGAKGWMIYGQPAKSEADAEWICTSTHVAPIINGKVYNCAGVGQYKEIKAYSVSDANKNIFGNNGHLRKR